MSKIVVGFDLSPSSQKALAWAAEYARLTGLPLQAVHAVPVVLWLAGIACYHLLPRWLPGLGAALPTLALCLLLAWATRPREA